jgi:hypothetical protein
LHCYITIAGLVQVLFRMRRILFAPQGI